MVLLLFLFGRTMILRGQVVVFRELQQETQTVQRKATREKRTSLRQQQHLFSLHTTEHG